MTQIYAKISLRRPSAVEAAQSDAVVAAAPAPAGLPDLAAVAPAGDPVGAAFRM
jgi:hypothetical protein